MRLRSFWHFNRLTFVFMDYALLWLAVVCAFRLTPYYSDEIFNGIIPPRENWFVGYGMPLFMALGLQVTGLQRNRSGFHASEAIAQTLAGLASGMLAFVVLHALVEFSLIGRYILILSVTYGTALIVGSRMLVWKLAEIQKRNVIFFGKRAISEKLGRVLKEAALPIELVGSVMPEAYIGENGEDGIARSAAEIFARAKQAGAEEIVVEVADELAATERKALLLCTGMGISVVDIGSFYERVLEQVYVKGLNEAWFWGYDPAYLHPVYFGVKRLLDISVSILGLLLFAPFAVIIIPLIKLQDGGPAIYAQWRIGLNNQTFLLYKFRTMRMDAEKEGAQWAKENDDRITWLGRFLRLSRIDEVPQFWNILRGEMSLIGPRPERPEMVEKIELEVPYFRYRHLIKPGLTGWAQINYPYGSTIDDARQKLAFDLYYIKYGTVTRELHILLRTAVAMVRGAR